MAPLQRGDFVNKEKESGHGSDDVDLVPGLPLLTM